MPDAEWRLINMGALNFERVNIEILQITTVLYGNPLRKNPPQVVGRSSSPSRKLVCALPPYARLIICFRDRDVAGYMPLYNIVPFAAPPVKKIFLVCATLLHPGSDCVL